MGKLNLQETVLPLLLKRGEERRGEKRRKQRVQTIFELQKIMQNPNSTLDEKMQAGAELGSYGQNVPQSAYKRKTDWESKYIKYKVPPTLQDMHRTGAYTDQEMTQWIVEKMDSSSLKTTEDVQFMIENIPELEGTDPDQMLAYIRHKEYLGVEATNKLRGGGKPSAIEERNAAIKKIMKGRGRDELEPFEKGQLKALGIPSAELESAYDLSDDDTEASEIIKMRRQIALEYAKSAMQGWSMRNITPTPGMLKELEETVKAFLEGEKLLGHQQEVLDFIKENRKAESRDQIEQMLREERPWGLKDIDIRIIMRAL